MRQGQCVPKIAEALSFNLIETLYKHSWKGRIDIQEAEKILEGRPAFSYLTRFGEKKSQFTLSFVHSNGFIHHEYFVCVDWVRGIFQNGGPYKAALELLIPYKMQCSASDAKPV